jgi:hypothetical protein
VVYIAPISVSESARLHLLAVTADGRRLYFSTSDAGAYGASSQVQRPAFLRAQVARQAPPQPANAAAARGGSQQPPRHALDVSCLLCCHGSRLRYNREPFCQAEYALSYVVHQGPAVLLSPDSCGGCSWLCIYNDLCFKALCYVLLALPCCVEVDGFVFQGAPAKLALALMRMP